MNAAPQSVQIDPAQDSRGFRNCLGRFATGVTVITTMTDDGQKVGITANSFAAVSLDPALVLWSPAKSARRHDVFAEATHFAVHILHEDQADIANGFVKEANAFDALDVALNARGTPIIANTLACFECTTHDTIDAGDHTIILGQVHACHQMEGSPLIFASGAYGSLAKT